MRTVSDVMLHIVSHDIPMVSLVFEVQMLVKKGCLVLSFLLATFYFFIVLECQSEMLGSLMTTGMKESCGRNGMNVKSRLITLIASLSHNVNGYNQETELPFSSLLRPAGLCYLLNSPVTLQKKEG